MAYSTQQNASGLYEVYQDGQRIGTGTKSYADSYTARNTVTPSAPAASPQQPTQPQYFPRYSQAEQSAENYLQTFNTPQSAEDLQAGKLKAAQAEIDNLNRYYDQLKGEQQIVNDNRSRSNASINTLTGLAGSTEANVTTERTDKLNQGALDKIAAERGAAIAQVLSNVRTSAVEEARQQRLEARQSAQDIMANRTRRQQEAVQSLTMLAQGGTTLEGLKQSSPEEYSYLIRQLGSEEKAKALFTLNRPQENILDKRIENGKYVIAYQNPLTGAVRIETVDLGMDIPSDYKVADLGGQLMFYNPANPKEAFFQDKSLTPDQRADNSLSWYKAQQKEDNPLTPYQQAQSFTGISNKYQSDTFINNAVKGQNAIIVARQVIADPNNATNQLKALYSLVKNLDPDSAVREGELSLAAQTQSYFGSFGNVFTRISEGRVISPSVATEMANATIELANAWNETAKRRQAQYKSQAQVAGVGDQFDRYLAGFDSEFTAANTETPAGNIITAPNGDEIEIID